IIGGINNTTLSGDIGYKENSHAQTNEFIGINGIYSVKSTLKITSGVHYHHFSYYTDYKVSLGTRSTIYDFKLLTIPLYFTITSNENKKYYFQFHLGPEFGYTINMNSFDYVNEKFNSQNNLEWTGLPVFVSGGTHLYYVIRKNFII